MLFDSMSESELHDVQANQTGIMLLLLQTTGHLVTE